MTTKTKDYLGHEFVITREFDAPRELVFKAWTDPKQLAEWWGPKGFTNPVCEWDVRPGGKIYDVMRAPNGDDYPMGGVFREIKPPERLVISCGALDKKGKLLFEFVHDATFTEKKGKTKLTLRSKVTMTTPDANRYIGGFTKGMTSSLERLAGMMKTKPFVIERILDAPTNLVWRALTSPEDMKRWYFDMQQFKPEVGCDFRFVVVHDGKTHDHRCHITDVVPQKKIAYTWRFEGREGLSLVTFELSGRGRKTRLRLTHAGLESFGASPMLARKNFVKGWTRIIGFWLKDFVENLDREIYIVREVNAPRELVWEAMTNPKHVVNWWGPRGFTTTVEKMDVRPGGVWKHVMQGPDGTKYPNQSVFKKVEKPDCLVFSHGGHREGGPGISFLATWSFDALGPDKTRVSIHMVFPSTAKRDFVVKEFGAVEGGKQTLARLEEFLQKMRTKKKSRAAA
ncbi:MAG TPA: SRPBCC domain-containing protein [Verrucomicrobiae bacterium]|jgi:uncharacterized protein YndB with AHSA1/START domain